MRPTMRTSAYRSSTWSRKSPRALVFPVIFATFPSRASRRAFRNTRRIATRRNTGVARKKANPAPAATRNAAQLRAFGLTVRRRSASGRSARSANALRDSSTNPLDLLAPVDPARLPTVALALQPLEHAAGALLGRPARRVDLEDGRSPGDRFLQDHVDRLRLHVLPDLLDGPPPRPEPPPQLLRVASEHDDEVHGQAVGVVRLQERDLRRHVETAREGVHVHDRRAVLVRLGQSHLLGGDVEVHDVVSAPREDGAHRGLPGPRRPGHRDEHAAKRSARTLKVGGGGRPHSLLRRSATSASASAPSAYKASNPGTFLVTGISGMGSVKSDRTIRTADAVSSAKPSAVTSAKIWYRIPCWTSARNVAWNNPNVSVVPDAGVIVAPGRFVLRLTSAPGTASPFASRTWTVTWVVSLALISSLGRLTAIWRSASCAGCTVKDAAAEAPPY